MTAVGVESQISEAFMLRLAALTLTPAVPVAYPNTGFPGKNADGTPKTKPDTYLEAHQMRAETQPLGVSAWDERPGIFQIDVVYLKQDGVIKPTEIADQVALWFKRGTRLTNGNVRVDIDSTPAIAAPIPDAPHIRTPVSIRYRVFTR